jgi:ribosomal protein L29
MKTRTKMILGGASALLALGMGLHFASPGPVDTGLPDEAPSPTRAQPPVDVAAPALPPAAVPPAPAAGAAPAGAPDAELEQLVTVMREKFGPKLHEPSAQVRMLEELMRYFQKRSPDRWREELLAFLQRAFPEQYEQLAATLRNRLDYEKWVRDNDAYLRGLSPEQRRAALWDARNRLFGKEAAEAIWANELRNQNLADTLAALDAKPEASVTEKLSAYKQRVSELHGEKAEAYLARHQQELMNRFLDLSSVQRDLSAMTPEARSQQLRTIRKEMGLDEEALKRWDALDQTRDDRWSAGTRYMAERAALSRELSGEALEARLQEVRARYFGPEADIIAQEESTGFFRFERPRVWGRN